MHRCDMRSCCSHRGASIVLFTHTNCNTSCCLLGPTTDLLNRDESSPARSRLTPHRTTSLTREYQESYTPLRQYHLSPPYRNERVVRCSQMICVQIHGSSDVRKERSCQRLPVLCRSRRAELSRGYRETWKQMDPLKHSPSGGACRRRLPKAKDLPRSLRHLTPRSSGLTICNTTRRRKQEAIQLKSRELFFISDQVCPCRE